MPNAHLLTELALIVLTLLTPLLFLGLSYYAGTHYTRLPDGEWTTWERSLRAQQEQLVA